MLRHGRTRFWSLRYHGGQPALGHAGKPGAPEWRRLVWSSGPKELRGSLLAAKPGMSFGGDGDGSARYAMVRSHQGRVVEGDVVKLRVSISGGAGGAVLHDRLQRLAGVLTHCHSLKP